MSISRFAYSGGLTQVLCAVGCALLLLTGCGEKHGSTGSTGSGRNAGDEGRLGANQSESLASSRDKQKVARHRAVANITDHSGPQNAASANDGFELARSFEGHEGAVLQAFFVRDHTRVATYGVDGTFRLWDTLTSKELKKIEGRFSELKTFDHSADGTRILSPTGDYNRLSIWELETGKQLTQLVGLEAPAEAVALSPEANLAAAASASDILVWNANSSKAIHQLHGHTPPICALVFSKDGKKLLSADQNGEILYWDVESGARTLRLDSAIGSGQPYWLEFSPDGKRAYSIGTTSIDQTLLPTAVKVWDLTSGKMLSELPFSFTNVQRMRKQFAISADGRLLAAPQGFEGRTTNKFGIWIWDLSSRKQVGEAIPAHSKYVTSIAFSPDNRSIISSSMDSFSVLYGRSASTQAGSAGADPPQSAGFDRLKLSPERTLPMSKSFCINFSPDGRRMVSGGFDKSVSVCDLNTGRIISNWQETRADFDYRATGRIGFIPNGERVFVCAWNEVAIRNAEDGKSVLTFSGHKSQILCAAVAERSTELVSAADDGIYLLWDYSSGKTNKEFNIPGQRPPKQIAMLQDGRLLVLTDYMFLYDLKGENRVRSFESSNGAENFVLLKDGTIVARGPSGTFVWNAKSARPIRTLDALGSDNVLATNLNPASQNFGERVVVDSGAEWMHTDSAGTYIGWIKGGAGLIALFDAKYPAKALSVGGSLQRIWFSPDGKRFITAGEVNGRGLMQSWSIRG